MSLSEKFYFGYLTFEEVRGTDALVRRFFVLNTANARLEYYADDSVWVVIVLWQIYVFLYLTSDILNIAVITLISIQPLPLPTHLNLTTVTDGTTV